MSADRAAGIYGGSNSTYDIASGYSRIRANTGGGGGEQASPCENRNVDVMDAKMRLNSELEAIYSKVVVFSK